MVDLATGARILAAIGADFQGDALIEAVLPAAQAQAKRYAGAHPTPQSRIAATGLVVRGLTLEVPPSSGLAYEVAGGSEYGSTLYRQFGPRRSSPAWLGRVAEGNDPAIVSAGDKALEEIMDRHI